MVTFLPAHLSGGDAVGVVVAEAAPASWLLPATRQLVGREPQGSTKYSDDI